MSKTKFTPAPWKVLNFGEAISVSPVGREDENVICDIIPREKNFTAEDVANARLIAAAPALYQELAHLVRLLEPVIDQIDIPGLATLNGAKAALAKAEGKDE